MENQSRNNNREVIIFSEAKILNGSVLMDGGLTLTVDGFQPDGDDCMSIIGFEASDDLIRQIDELKRRTDSTTRAEIFRKALKTYEVLTRKAKEGKEITMVDSEGKLETIILP